jgi:hypothetical protein
VEVQVEGYIENETQGVRRLVKMVTTMMMKENSIKLGCGGYKI